MPGDAEVVRVLVLAWLAPGPGSWIFMPATIEVLASADGRTFSHVGAARNAISEQESKPSMQDLTVSVPEPTRARHVRIVVQGRGTIPAWHPGAGEAAWFFTDEIIVR